jgi:aspartate/methionine/tyrosine aminotransferase
MLPNLSLSDTTLSSIRETFKAVKDDQEIINLCLGDPYGNPPPEVIDSYIRAIQDGKTHYENDAGMPRLREAIIAYENKIRGCNLHCYNNIVITNGGINGIYSFSRAILDPGDEVLLLDPTWVPFIQITHLLRCRPVLVPTKQENDFIPDIEELKRHLSPRTKALIVVSPGNPSGTVFGEDAMKSIVQFCEDYGLWLLHDEAYRDIIFDDLFQSSYVGHHENIVGVRTLSKSHNMTGFRVGWIISSNKNLIDRVRKNVAYNVMCVNTAAQYAALTAIEECQDWLLNNVDSYHKKMLLASQKLKNIGFDVTFPKGSFYLFPRHYYGKPIAKNILLEAKLAVIDGYHFGNCGENHIRISCSVSDHTLNEGIDRLAQWVSYNDSASK